MHQTNKQNQQLHKLTFTFISENIFFFSLKEIEMVEKKIKSTCKQVNTILSPILHILKFHSDIAYLLDWSRAF